MIQKILVAIIVVVALSYLLKRFRSAGSSPSNCGCSCKHKSDKR